MRGSIRGFVFRKKVLYLLNLQFDARSNGPPPKDKFLGNVWIGTGLFSNLWFLQTIQLRKRTFRHRAFILEVLLELDSASKTCCMCLWGWAWGDVSEGRGLFFGSLILDPGCPKHDAGVILVLVVLVLCLSFPANRQAGAGGDYRIFCPFFKCP